MADEEEEMALVEQLQLQILEQKDSLAAVDDALSAEPLNPELISVHVDLVQAIKTAEQSLLQLKKARLLREADSALQVSPSYDDSDPQAKTLVNEGYSVGSKCRFRHTDGRWYNGLVVDLEDQESSAKVSFLTPTSDGMLMCKFFLQQRCRFGSNCRLSHGVDIPVSFLKKYVPMTWGKSLVGSSIWAVSDSKADGIWRVAELNSWDEGLKTGEVVFRDDGSSEMLGTEAIMLSEYAQMSEGDDTSSDSDYSDDDESSSQGLGLGLGFSNGGVQKETAIFAKWENHTRGIASKMMANMGYREGMGLGASGQGMLNPIPVRLLPSNQSLDDAVKNIKHDAPQSNKKQQRSRGGKRKRDKKLAAEARRAEEEEESGDVFSLINNHLAATPGDHVKKLEKKAGTSGEDRRALVAHEDEIKNLRLQIDRLKEMAKRNKKEKVVFEAATRKLLETTRALADAETARDSASNAVATKEKEKKWLKF
ncbi:hypothetical protein M569_16172 [Genlisea aurea]|uniref:Zinc finger CCCH domain-containing protein 18 n=1 Tax=Genlisea aurea TaxID=192259 RepID=S8BW89_9LAMI|nr:hypothetical protein M569_16172 [Genlisea aurea]